MYGIKFPNSWRLGLILVMVLVVQLEAVFGVLLCSRCDSRKDSFYKECEQTPPAPSPCPQHSHSLYCSIVRETDPNGEQILFARDCTTSYLEDTCVIRNGSYHQMKTVCFQTCQTDGCNGGEIKSLNAASPYLPTTTIMYAAAILKALL
ncbi:Hypothetical predicted protein [Octopus vulgaris]|uniref:Uncharacterized protein n=1 Tax=Octopus vulgaris TaxID=6645 RepID=A0AA36FKR0_OCTVU|nr:Hypothetical predicted protein [Octopus vulgaris]